MMSESWHAFEHITADISQCSSWPAQVQIIQTTVGQDTPNEEADILDVYGKQNLGLHVQDSPQSVHTNRMRLLQTLQPQGVSQLHWLNQIHSTRVVQISADRQLDNIPTDADAMITDQAGQGLCIMTADCLPIVMTDTTGSTVAAVHAGWRGLQAGIVQRTANNLPQPPAFAWIGAAISQPHFEVGREVMAAFTHDDSALASYFSAQDNGKYLGDLAGIAQLHLSRLGIQGMSSGRCSYADSCFYSYRRATHQGDPRTGRMATVIWKNSI